MRLSEKTYAEIFTHISTYLDDNTLPSFKAWVALSFAVGEAVAACEDDPETHAYEICKRYLRLPFSREIANLVEEGKTGE